MLFWLLLAQALFAPGSTVEVQTSDGWVPGLVAGVERDGGKVEYKVTVKSGNFTFDRYFQPNQVRAAAKQVAVPGLATPAFTTAQAVEAHDWDGSWRRGTVTRVERSADSWRYLVKFADGGETAFYGDRIRAASGPAPAAKPAASNRQLVYGEYNCTRWLAPGQDQPPVGTITLLANGTYRWLDNGGSGRYSYNAATGAMRFLNGPLAAKQPKTVTYERDAAASQIDINFAYGVDWSCGHNL